MSRPLSGGSAGGKSPGKPKIQKTASRPTSRLELLPPDHGSPKKEKTRTKAVPAAHRQCCGTKVAVKQGGVLLGAARKDVQKKDSASTAGAAASCHRDGSSSAGQSVPAQANVPEGGRILQLGSGSKYPHTTDALGYLQFIQHQANLLHTVQQQRMRASAQAVADDDSDADDQHDSAGDASEDDNSGHKEVESSDMESDTGASGTEEDDDENDDDDEEEGEDDDDAETVPAPNPNPALVTVEGVLGLAGISLPEFESWKLVDGKAPLELTACLLQCMTGDKYPTALVLCQKVLQMEPHNKLMQELYPTIMSRLKQLAYNKVQESLEGSESDATDSSDEDDDDDDDDDDEAADDSDSDTGNHEDEPNTAGSNNHLP